MTAERMTEQQNPDTRGLDEMSVEGILEVMQREQHKPAEAVGRCLVQMKMAVERIVEGMRRGGRLFYVGAGTSGRLGVLDASECPPTFHVPPDLVQGIIAGGDRALREAVEAAEDDRDAGAAALAERGLRAADTVVGITCSGGAPYVAGAFDEAARVGAYRVLLACVTSPELGPLADLCIQPLVGPEVLAGSTRLKSGTATKMVLNMLSTATMVRLGKVYDNLMVDLRPTNDKLRLRARRLVQHLTKLDDETVDHLLAASGWRVKTAVLMARGLTRAEAEERLERHEGFLRAALEDTDAEGTNRK